MSRLARVLWVMFALLTVGLGAFYLAAAEHLFPVMNIDSAAHIVPIVNYKAGHGLTSVVWSLTRDYDPTGQHRFLQYPPLFHLVVASLIRHPTLVDIYDCLGGLACAGLVLYALLVWQRPVAGVARNRPVWIALACVSLGAVSTWLYQTPSSGRAETLSTPLLLLAALAVPLTPARWQPSLAGVFIGLLGATQPAIACLLGLLYSTYVSLRPTDRPPSVTRWLRPVALAGAVSLATFAACFLWSPYSLLETVRGMAVHLSQLPGSDLSGVAYYFVVAGNGTFYGVFFLVVLAHYVWWNRARLHWLAGINLGGFVLAAWALAVRHPNRSYNLLTFAPVFAALALHLVARLDNPEEVAGATVTRTQARAIYVVYFGVFALMSIGLARQAAIYAVFVRQGVSYQEAEHHFLVEVPPDSQAPILFDSGMYPLLAHFDHAYQRTSVDLAALDAVPEPTRPTLLIHQWYGRLASPPAIPGYRLAWNDFVAQPPPRFLGVKITGAMPGYAFAIYQPTSPP